MLVREFIERTHYEPTANEYHYIEESYYDFAGSSKDAFCKQWMEDKKSGKWELELRLRREIDEQKKEYEDKMAEMEENLQWYREQFEELKKYRGMIRRITNIVNE